MFQRAKTFARNHWKKAVFGGIAVQVAAYGWRYAANRLEFYREEEGLKYWKKLKKQQYFDNVDQNCITTFRQLFQVMRNKIGETLNAELIQEQLKLNQVQNKLEAWQELKVISFARILATIYGSSLLYVFLRVQLSMIGGYLIQESRACDVVEHGDSPTPKSKQLDEDAQRKYLDLSQYFVHEGIVKICQYARQQVESMAESISLKQSVSANDLEQLFWTIIRKPVAAADLQIDQLILENPIQVPWRYIFHEDLLHSSEFFTSQEMEGTKDKNIYGKLVCETYDLLESDDARDVLRYLESQGVGNYIDRITEFINDSSEPSPASDDILPEPRLAIAKLIPTMTSLHLVEPLEDPWIHILTSSDSVRVLSANIYEAFCAE